MQKSTKNKQAANDDERPDYTAIEWSEDRLQAECFKWSWNTFPETRRLLFHIPNERNARNIVEAAKMKALGVVKGAWDMLFIWCGEVYFFEFKVGKNKLSDDQLKFLIAVTSQKARCFEFRTLDDFKATFFRIVRG